MSNRSKKFSLTFAARLLPVVAVVVLLAALYPREAAPPTSSACDPNARPFRGYSFLIPDIINKNSAYAPFFVQWDDYYERFYFNQDIQREDNIEEWIERFCAQPVPEDVDRVVYASSINDLVALSDYIREEDGTAPLPYPFAGNTFAYMLFYNKCTEVLDYLIYARKCEPYVIAAGDGWQPLERDPDAMQTLLQEGIGRFKQTYSHFVKLRYAYQIIRLAHYSKQWQQTIDLFNELMPQIDRRKSSIIFYWTLGHVAGALQQLGRHPEAAYRYSVIFRHCPSKRTQAFRSFLLRNDQDWAEALRLCQNDSERATLHLLRAGRSRKFTPGDLEAIYRLDPGNPQLDLLLISLVQDIEKILLRTSVTDRKYGGKVSAADRKAAALDLIDLQKLARIIIKEQKSANPRLWTTIVGYLELLAGDRHTAGMSLNRAERQLEKRKAYDAALAKQIGIWRLLLEIMQIDPDDAFADQAAFRVRSYETFQKFPHFEPFLQDWLSAAYAASNRPGKAILLAYPPQALTYNPSQAVIDDLLKAADEDNPIFLEKAMQMDTNPDHLRAYLLQIKGASLLAKGQPEAAIAVMQQISPYEKPLMAQFSPFREVLHEHVHRPVTDTLLLNRLQIADKLLEFEFQARAKSALGDPDAARFYYLIGLAYYNMSYFGYEWEAADFYRSGANWNRLAAGPVFPLAGSPSGNRENLDLNLALDYFRLALRQAQDPEMAARAAFMAARCQQKQWFSSPECDYRPGSKQIPVLPEAYNTYYELIRSKYRKSDFYDEAIKECKWLEAYMR